MPYKRIPTSDGGRITALDDMITEAGNLQPGEINPLEAQMDAITLLRDTFISRRLAKSDALTAQRTATTAKDAARGDLHGLTRQGYNTLYDLVKRGEGPDAALPGYGLNINQRTLPPMSKEDKLERAARNFVAGEDARIAAGGDPLGYPVTREAVQEKRTAFEDAERELSNKKMAYDDAQASLEEVRKSATLQIRRSWSDLDRAYTYQGLSKPSVRRKLREWGVKYVFRPGETLDDEEGETVDLPPQEEPGGEGQ